MASFAAEVRASWMHRSPAQAWQASLARLEATSAWLRARAGEDANLVSAVAVEYLQLFGLTAYAYMWARMAAVALARREEDDAFHGAKLACAASFFQRVCRVVWGWKPVSGRAAAAFMGWRRRSPKQRTEGTLLGEPALRRGPRRIATSVQQTLASFAAQGCSYKSNSGHRHSLREGFSDAEKPLQI